MIVSTILMKNLTVHYKNILYIELLDRNVAALANPVE